ncbi:MAG: glycosyltransferase [Bacteroidota bacterium]|nr:glycosyltransferase [Bacteroidota bacterium]
MKQPKLSVILPYYNAEEFLQESISSILNQTFTDFELIIIDDGSTDRSAEIISGQNDPRIRVIRNEKNYGLIETLNTGFRNAKGEFIARMDADDISRAERFEKQVSFLEKNSAVGVCGTWMHMIHNNKVYKHRYLTSDLIKSALVFNNPIVHPSVMLRKTILPGDGQVYNPAYPHGEDYALWISLSDKTDFAVIGEPLIEYRAHAQQVSRKFNDIQRASVKKAQELIFTHLGIHANEAEKEIHFSLFLEDYEQTKTYYDAVEKWLLKLVTANEKTKSFDSRAFRNVSGEWWFRVNRELAPFGIGSYSQFKTSALSAEFMPSAAAVAKLRVKAILKPGNKK